MRYQVQTLESDTSDYNSPDGGLRWTPYRDGQLFKSESAAQRLLARIAARRGSDTDLRVAPVGDHQLTE